MANGFANRFLWICTRRSKLLPHGGRADAAKLKALQERVRRAVKFARSIGELQRDADANMLWSDVYAELSEGKHGLLGAVTSRSEAQVMRLACVYALRDGSSQIRREHLESALAVSR